MTDLKDKGVEISISSIATMIPVGIFLWFVIQPIMLSDLSKAMADDLKVQMDAHAEPVQNAFKLIIKGNINKLKRSIAALEYSRDADPQAWTAARNQILVDNEIELESLEEAYDAL